MFRGTDASNGVAAMFRDMSTTLQGQLGPDTEDPTFKDGTQEDTKRGLVHAGMSDSFTRLKPVV